MNLIKLDAIDSTNDFLKAISQNENVENFTVVTAKTQTKGRGQMGAEWVSESGKNLTMSVLIKDLKIGVTDLFSLNIAVALSVISALEKFEIPKLAVKWPNDIMADSKKVGGILIENSFKTSGEIVSVVGIGLNVNQKSFEQLLKASSLSIAADKDFDLDEILVATVDSLKNYTKEINDSREFQKAEYLSKLFRFGKPTAFRKSSENPFMASIYGVSENGKLQLLLEDDSIQDFEIKELEMLY